MQIGVTFSLFDKGYSIQKQLEGQKRKWCSGNIVASHATARGSIPRLRTISFLEDTHATTVTATGDFFMKQTWRHVMIIETFS